MCCPPSLLKIVFVGLRDKAANPTNMTAGIFLEQNLVFCVGIAFVKHSSLRKE